jgi:hypothetical protein
MCNFSLKPVFQTFRLQYALHVRCHYCFPCFPKIGLFTNVNNSFHYQVSLKCLVADVLLLLDTQALMCCHFWTHRHWCVVTVGHTGIDVLSLLDTQAGRYGDVNLLAAIFKYSQSAFAYHIFLRQPFKFFTRFTKKLYIM